MNKWPDWFPNLITAAQHQDKIAAWPWYGRLYHRWFVSFRCPACKVWRELE